MYYAKPKEHIFVSGVNNKSVFLHLLEYLYCDKFVEQMLIIQVRNVANLCKNLGLEKLYKMIYKQAESQRQKLITNIIKASQREEGQNANESQNSNRAITPKVKSLADEYETRIMLDFSNEEDSVQSPEDKQNRLHNRALDNMN